MQHVLPKGFVKIRHYGLLANRQRAEKLKLCRRLLLPVTVAAPALAPSRRRHAACQRSNRRRCRIVPKCGGCRFVRIELPKEAERATGAATRRSGVALCRARWLHRAQLPAAVSCPRCAQSCARAAWQPDAPATASNPLRRRPPARNRLRPGSIGLH